MIKAENQLVSVVDFEAEEFDKKIAESENKISDKQIHSTSEMLPSEEDSNDMPIDDVDDAKTPSKISKSAKDNTARLCNLNQIKPTRGRKKNHQQIHVPKLRILRNLKMFRNKILINTKMQ